MGPILKLRMDEAHVGDFFYIQFTAPEVTQKKTESVLYFVYYFVNVVEPWQVVCKSQR